MKKRLKFNSVSIFVCGVALIVSTLPVQARVVTQLMPTLTISEDYTDNYFKEDSGEEEEFITSVKLGFSLGIIDKKGNLYFSYEPEYLDYKNFGDRDRLQHNAGIEGNWSPTRFTDLTGKVVYTGNTENLPGESWENSIYLAGTTQVSKHTTLKYSESFRQSFDQTQRTGSYSERELNRTNFGLINKYDKKSSRGFNLGYEFDSYENSNADEYDKIITSGFLTHWFNQKHGLGFNAGYTDTEFDNNGDDVKSYTGDIRYIRNYSKHLDWFVKYRQSYADRDSGDHHIFHPSVGVDWEITEDSGITLGAGLLFHDWDNDNNDSTNPFIDIDAYKTFNFSRKGTLSITGTSGYSDAGEDAASLGFSTYYQAGFKLSYQFYKILSSNLYGSYKLDDYHEDANNRKDTRYNLGAGLSWIIKEWLRFNLTCSHENFDTDAATRGGYKVNKVFLSISLIPKTPVRFDTSPSRRALETELYR